MLFTQPCEHAIRALIYLSNREEGKPVQAITIADATNVPRQFLSKILLQLKHHGLVKTVKGPGGGYYIAKDTSEIMIRDITGIFDRSQQDPSSCILGLETCMDDHPCPLHHQWKNFRGDVEVQLKSLTIRELADKVAEKKAHLKAKD